MELGWCRENVFTNRLLDYNFNHYPRNRLKCGHGKHQITNLFEQITQKQTGRQTHF